MLNSFLSHADFSFPLTLSAYFTKHFFLIENSGLINFDGITRLFSRFLNFFGYAVGGNLFVSYFYPGITIVICFISFFIFARTFFNNKNKLAILITALFFAINPIYLGYISKVGLTFSIAFMPLILVCLKKYFQKNKISYLLLTVIITVFSFLHPFTTIVNSLIALIYFIYLFLKQKHKKNIIKHVLIALLVGILMFSYLILPLMATNNSLDRHELYGLNLTEKEKESEFLDVSTAENYINTFSLTKQVFVDYKPYNDFYFPIYILSTFAILFFALTSLIKDKQKDPLFLVSWLAFLLLMLLSTVDSKIIENILDYVVNNLPAGWMF